MFCLYWSLLFHLVIRYHVKCIYRKERWWKNKTFRYIVKKSYPPTFKLCKSWKFNNRNKTIDLFLYFIIRLSLLRAFIFFCVFLSFFFSRSLLLLFFSFLVLCFLLSSWLLLSFLLFSYLYLSLFLSSKNIEDSWSKNMRRLFACLLLCVLVFVCARSLIVCVYVYPYVLNIYSFVHVRVCFCACLYTSGYVSAWLRACNLCMSVRVRACACVRPCACVCVSLRGRAVSIPTTEGRVVGAAQIMESYSEPISSGYICSISVGGCKCGLLIYEWADLHSWYRRGLCAAAAETRGGP